MEDEISEQKIKTDLDWIASYFLRKSKSATEVGLFEFGIDDRRFDCIIVIGSQQKIRGYEFKVNRADYFNDIRKGKWKKYLPYCNTFSFVCPKGLINTNEVPEGIGLLWVTTVNEHYGYKDRKTDWPKGIWKKMPRFLGKIPEDKFRRIILTLLSRVKYRKDDFF